MAHNSKSKYNKYCREYRKKHKEMFRKIENQPKRIFSRTKHQAKVRKINWDLTFNEFMEFWQKPCIYCGKSIDTIGLDRIDTKKGYSIDNIGSCCGWCNTMKLDHTTKEFFEQCKRIIDFQLNK